MTEKQPYQPPLLEVHMLSTRDVICSSPNGNSNSNELEWDWN